LRDSGFDSVSVEIFSRRLKIVTLFVMAVFSILTLRLWSLQVLNGPNYRVQSENNRIHLQDIPPVRGMIFDRRGKLLVDNRPSYDLYITPEEARNVKEVMGRLLSLIDVNPEQIDNTLNSNAKMPPFKPFLIKENMSRDELAVIETNLFNLNGVSIQIKPRRHYMFGKFASHVIGYLGEISPKELRSGGFQNTKPGDLVGKYGVEGKWYRYLRGIRGGEQVEVDAAGRKLRVISRKPSVPGQNILLTIDHELQLLAESKLEGNTGAVVAMNPKNGEILALASSPAYDPNLFISGIDSEAWSRIIRSSNYPLQNRAIAGQYPPGSVFKIVVALAGLEEGVIDPEEEILCTGQFPFGNRVYRCWKKQGHGNISLHRAIVESCDIYFYKMGYRLGVEKIAHYAKMFGLGESTGFDLGGEKPGLVPTRKWKLKRLGIPWQAGETISLSIGQSFLLVTPLQMASLISTVFNGGHLYRPKVVKWIGKGKEKVYEFRRTSDRRVDISPDNMALIKEALVGVVNEERGTGKRARIRGVRVAGKTGTAQVVKLDLDKKYESEEDIPVEFRDHSWFVAIAPAEDPRIAVAVLIEHGGHGGATAAPIAKDLIEAFLLRGHKT